MPEQTNEIPYIYNPLSKVFSFSNIGAKFTISGPVMTFTDNSGKNHTMIRNKPIPCASNYKSPSPSPVPSPSPFVPIPSVVPLGLYYDQVDPVAIEVFPDGLRSVPLNGGSPSPIIAYIYDTMNKVFKVNGRGSFTISGPIMTFTDNSGKNHTLILNTPANS
jgi:hypothetical protein